MLAAGEIGEGEFGAPRSGQRLLSADDAQIIVNRAIAGEHEMIAVVDDAAKLGVEIGAAAAARLPRRLEQHHARAFVRQRHGGGKSSKSSSDDIDRAHACSPCRSMIIANCALGMRTRLRGDAQPAASILRRISE